MTVNELIEILKKYPGNMRVLNGGYEGGYHDMIEDSIRMEEVILNYHFEPEYLGETGIYGPHELVEHRLSIEPIESKDSVIKVLILDDSGGM